MDPRVAIFKIAWEYQGRARVSQFRHTDVDRECLGYFEEHLFKNSKRAGQAGNHQWGLDAGAHQDRWNPYVDIPYDWNHEDRDEENKSEFQVGPIIVDLRLFTTL
ncbi:hypothetical protein K438DRAFT_1613279 [Mycena galopus ATCC 62051]|nr:hypothetical protein K438DRAFT_1613279 [Mycena galopus ATCC 62051]